MPGFAPAVGLPVAPTSFHPAPTPDTSWLAQAWHGPQVVGNAVTSITLDFSGAPVGEWLFAVIGLAQAQDTLPRPPAGWGETIQVREGTPGGASSSTIVWQRIKQPGDTTFAFSWVTSCLCVGQPMSWFGLDPQTPVESVAYTVHTSGTSYPTGTVTPTRADRRVVGVFFQRGTTSFGTWIPPVGMRERVGIVGVGGGSTFALLEIADTIGTVGTAGASYTATCTATASHGAGIGFALVPAGSVNPLVGRQQTAVFPGSPFPVAQLLRQPASTVLPQTTTPALTDVGSAADGIAVTVTVPVADAGSAADTAVVSAAVPVTDAGSTADAIAVSAAVPLPDAATGVDGAVVAGTVPLSDTASAADVVATLAALALAESATALDAFGAVATVALPDAAIGADTVSVATGSTNKALTDVGTVRERLHVLCIYDTGITGRPATGTTVRPSAGTTVRPNTGTTARSDAGTTYFQ